MEKVSKILNKVLNYYSLGASAKSSIVCENFKRFFIKNWGEENFNEISSMKFKNGNLVVFVNNSAWSYQIYLKKSDFLDSVKKMILEINVKDLIIKVTN